MTQPNDSDENSVQDARRAQMARWRANWTDLQAAEGASSVDMADELQALIDKLHLESTIADLQHHGFFILAPLMAALTLVAYILGLWRRFRRYWQAGRPMGQRGDRDTPG